MLKNLEQKKLRNSSSFCGVQNLIIKIIGLENCGARVRKFGRFYGIKREGRHRRECMVLIGGKVWVKEDKGDIGEKVCFDG